MSDDLLDIGEEKSTDSSILTNVRWWERMRIVYNIIIIGIIATSFFFVRSGYSYGYSYRRVTERIIVLGIYLVIVNLFYCLGWGLDLLLRHYFKTKGFGKGLNISLFVLGTLLVALFTLFISFVARL